MIIHHVETGGARLGIVSARMQRAANPIPFRPTHITIISLVADARQRVIVRPIGHTNILRLVPYGHATLEHALDG